MTLHINGDDISGVIETQEELNKVAEWLGVPAPAQLARHNDGTGCRADPVLYHTSTLSDGRCFTSTYGVGDWIWLRS